MPIQRTPGLSPAADALGLGEGLGGALREQVGEVSEEERKKRMQEIHQRQLTGLSGSPATIALLGGAYGQRA